MTRFFKVDFGPLLLAAMGLLGAMAFSGCSSIFFLPTREYVATPDQLGLSFEPVSIPVGGDGGKKLALAGWWMPAAVPACGTVVVFHGNAQNMSNHLFGVSWLPAAGFNLFIFDYRGYGSSPGRPFVPSLIKDGESVLETVFSRLDSTRASGQPPQRGTPRIAIYGQSIGGALAAPIAAGSKFRDRFAAIILESVFYGYSSIVREKLDQFFLTWPLQYPLSWLFLSKFDPVDYVEQLAPIPLLFVTGLADQIVFPENTRKLYARAKVPKVLWEFPEAGHINSFQFPENRKKLIQYLRNAFGCTDPAAPTIK